MASASLVCYVHTTQQFILISRIYRSLKMFMNYRHTTTVTSISTGNKVMIMNLSKTPLLFNWQGWMVLYFFVDIHGNHQCVTYSVCVV